MPQRLFLTATNKTFTMRDGVINILKPTGMTSSDVVIDVRRIISNKRVGHTGTLDPGAAGVLPICVGKATKLFDYLVDKEKEYLVEITFGLQTDTQDAYGSIISQNEKPISKSDILTVLPEFCGDIEQMVPMYSAVSVNGHRMYELARRNTEPVERKTRHITVYGIDFVNQLAEKSFMLRVRCSKGTYIRTLCNDIGLRLGSVAYMSYLLRSVSGVFNISDTISISELKTLTDAGRLDECIMPVDTVIASFPEIRVCNCTDMSKLLNGVSIKADGKYSANTPLRLYYYDRFVGICVVDDGLLSIKTRFCDTDGFFEVN